MDKRRPIKSRSNPLMIQLAQWLSQKAITPNQISLFSILPAFLTLFTLGFWTSDLSRTTQLLLLFLTLILIQLRLLCNLIDGMVAIEGGKVTPAGELFNEVPDRVSDTFFFIALGMSLGSSTGFSLGLLAALMAALTAYVRVLGVSMGAPPFFSGPMAKQQRMALMTFAIIATMIGLFFDLSTLFLEIALWLIIIGSFITVLHRLGQIYRYKNNRL